MVSLGSFAGWAGGWGPGFGKGGGEGELPVRSRQVCALLFTRLVDENKGLGRARQRLPGSAPGFDIDDGSQQRIISYRFVRAIWSLL